MQAEADDQHRRQADRAGFRRDPDREALGEVVQADRGRDHHARLQRALPGVLGALLCASALLGLSTAAASPPAIGAGAVRRERSLRSTAEMPAVPTVKPTASSANRPSTWPKPLVWPLKCAHGRFEDLLAVLGDVHEDERQDPHREHRQADAQAIVDVRLIRPSGRPM